MNNSLLASLLLAAVANAAEVPLKPFEAVEPHMGTLIRIKLYAADQAAAQAAFKAAFDRIAQLDRELSDYKPDSELNTAAAAAYEHPVSIGHDLDTILAASLIFSRETDGAFDVTVGPLTKLWRKARKTHEMPDKEVIEAARAHCGYRKLQLDETAHTMTLDGEGMQLDVGAIAKGYAADQALAAISNLGIHIALVAASGDLAFSDAPPDEPGWKIGIDSLDQADKPFTRVLRLKNAAVSTSGSTEQSFEVNGKRYSHILNPKTGFGLTSDISVTTIARLGIDADGADTAISVLGPKKGLAFVAATEQQHPGLAAFILQDGKAYESPNFVQLYGNSK